MSASSPPRWFLAACARSACLGAALLLTLAAPPIRAAPPDPADARSAVELLRDAAAATVPEPMRTKLVRGLEKALAKHDKAAAKVAANGKPKSWKKPRNRVRAFLKKIGWKEKKGLLKPKRNAKLDPTLADPLRDAAAAILATYDALILGLGELPASGVLGPGGGAVTSEDGKLTLGFPPGALPERSAIVTIRRVDPADLGPEFAGIVIDAAYELGPDGLEFEEPVRVALELDEPVGPSGETATTDLPLLLVSSEGALELPDQELVAGLGARSLSVVLEHFSGVTLAEEVADGLMASVMFPENQVQLVGRPATITARYKATTENQVRSSSIFYLDDSLGPFRIEGPDEVRFAGSVKEAEASDGEEELQYVCVRAGVSEYDALVRFTQFEVLLARKIFYRARFERRIYCQSPNGALGVEEIELERGRLEFRVAPPKVTKRVGESFEVDLAEDVDVGGEARALFIFVTDVRDEQDIISEPALVEVAGVSDATLKARNEDDPDPSAFHRWIVRVPGQGAVANGESRQTLEFTCLKPGVTLLAYDISVGPPTEGPPPVYGRVSLSTIVRCVEEVGALPPTIEDEEPNDTPQTAQGLDLGAGGEAFVSGSLGPADPADHYAIQVAEATGLRIEEQLEYDPVEVDLRLTDELGLDVGCKQDGVLVANLDPGETHTLTVTMGPSNPPGASGSYFLQAVESALVAFSRGAAPECEGTGTADCPQDGIPCGSQGGGICVRGLCMVEVPMNQGVDGSSVCAAEGLTCSGVPALDFPEGEACLAFHPTARETFGPSGWKQSVYCNGAGGAACNGQVDTCWDCPFCLADQLGCSTGASAELDALFASCE